MLKATIPLDEVLVHNTCCYTLVHVKVYFGFVWGHLVEFGNSCLLGHLTSMMKTISVQNFTLLQELLINSSFLHIFGLFCEVMIQLLEDLRNIVEEGAIH